MTSELPLVVMIRNGQVVFEPGQPVLKTHGAEPGILARCERPIVQSCSEKPGMDVGDDLARVLCRGQVLPGKIIETERFRSGQFNDAVDGTPSAMSARAAATSSEATG